MERTTGFEPATPTLARLISQSQQVAALTLMPSDLRKRFHVEHGRNSRNFRNFRADWISTGSSAADEEDDHDDDEDDDEGSESDVHDYLP